MKSSQIIKVTNLTKKFKKFTAVDNISFSVNKGEIFAFLGPNGAGKSTTIKMLTTLLTPTSGEISLNSYNVKEDKDAVRQSLGIVFQDPSLDDDLTALENMQLHAALYSIDKSKRSKRIQTMMEFVELWDRRKSLVKTFSGGMKRRLEIARGLLHHPKILFLDEPSLGLDPQTRNHLWNYIVRTNKEEGMTVFMTTHYMEEAEKIANRIAVIDHGKIIALGTAKELEKQTRQSNLEDAYLELTGHAIREEDATGIDKMRQRRHMMRRH
ncbi:MAG: ATP-binding cassette domain-containing protein [bacterium]